MSFLVASGVEKSYEVGTSRLPVLKGLDVSLEKGEMVAVVGASGVGKSTLLHVLGGLDAADAGPVQIGDTDLTRAARTRRWSRSATGTSGSSSSSITCCRSSPRSRTPRCRCASRGVPRAERAAARQRAAAAGRPRRAARAPAGHDVGRRAAARRDRARAGDGARRILLADEPTGDLDEHTADTLHELLREMHRERGLTSLIATHNPRLAAACDRILRLADGRLSPA